MRSTTLVVLVVLVLAQCLLVSGCLPSFRESAVAIATIAAAKATEAAAVQTITKATAATGGPVVAPTHTPWATAIRPTVTPPGARATATRTPTPTPSTYVVTTRSGKSTELTSLDWVITGYYASYEQTRPQGVPLASGVEVSLDYVSRVEFTGAAGSAEPTGAIVTLTDGTVLRDDLGFKVGFGLKISGKADLGSFEVPLSDVQAITVQRKGSPKAIPGGLPSPSNVAVVENAKGERTRVSGLSFRVRCVRGVLCCYGERLSTVPLEGGVGVDLGRIKVIEVGEVTAGKPVPARITLADGRVLTEAIRPSTECGSAMWRLEGQAALGSFEIQLGTVRRIEPEHDPAAPTPRPTSAGLAGTVFTRQGAAVEVAGLTVARSTNVPLKGGLHVALNRIKEITFGSEAEGQVPVTITTTDGRVLSDAVDAGALVEGSTSLGTFSLAARGIARITMKVSPSSQTPPPTPVGPKGTLYRKQGATIEFASLKVGGSSSIPLKSGLRVELNKVKEVRLGDEADGQVPVSLTTTDGRVVTDSMPGSTLFTGDTGLGTFSFPAREVARVVIKG